MALALTGVALIAILFGFAMSVMPHLSAGGKIAAVVLQAGVATTAFALLCQPECERRRSIKAVIPGSARSTEIQLKSN